MSTNRKFQNRLIGYSIFLSSLIAVLYLAGYDFHMGLITGKSSTFTYDDYQFSITYPGRWTLFRHGESGYRRDRTRIISIYPIQPFNEKVPDMVTIHAYESVPISNSQEIVDRRINELQQLYSSFHLDELIPQPGEELPRLIYTFGDLKCNEDFVIAEENILVFSMCADVSGFDVARISYIQIRDSFRENP